MKTNRKYNEEPSKTQKELKLPQRGVGLTTPVSNKDQNLICTYCAFLIYCE